MDSAAHFIAGQRGNHALDLAPVAKTDDVALATAVFGTRGGFKAGIVAKGIDQLGGINNGRTRGDKKPVHADRVNAKPLRFGPSRKVNEASTMLAQDAS